MATPPIKAPLTLEEQELQMVAVVLQARGWLIAEQRKDGDTVTIIARRTFGFETLPKPRLKDNA